MLLRTDRNFGARAWHRGETIEALNNYIVQDEVSNGDTFVNTSLQVRSLVSIDRILCIPQYHGSPDDLGHHARRYNLWDGKAPWVHVGSLSSGVGGILRDEKNRPLARRTIDLPQDSTILPKQWCQSDGEKMEFERRVQWWLTFWEKAHGGEFYSLYGKAVFRIIEQFGLSMDNIRRRQLIYAEIGC